MNNTQKFRAVSLFSGAGGLDVGFRDAGANIVWANDINKDACKTYTANFGNHIRCGSLEAFKNELDSINDIDLVFGGPPCQGFSVAGKMNPQDPRSQLIWEFLDVVKKVAPKAFVMENVKALGTLSKWETVRKSLLNDLRKLGYSTSYVVLNASDYDVPQARERVFFIGFKGDSRLLPDLEKMLIPYKHKSKTVKEALAVLDKAGEGNNSATCKAKITLAASPVLRKSPYAGMIFNGLGRPIKIDGYCSTLPASMGGNKTPIIDEEELYNSKKSWVVEYHQELWQNKIAPEFRDAPSFLRRLTVAEAALIQTFPLDFKFCGSQSSIYTQIGNAVPCNLGKAVAKMVMDILSGNANIKHTTNQLELL